MNTEVNALKMISVVIHRGNLRKTWIFAVFSNHKIIITCFLQHNPEKLLSVSRQKF